MGICLYSFRHHPSKIRRNTKVFFYCISLSFIWQFKTWQGYIICFSISRSFHLVSFWILFENTMSLHRTKATIIGLLEASRVNEWVVTEKLGATLKAKGGGKVSKNTQLKIGDR